MVELARADSAALLLSRLQEELWNEGHSDQDPDGNTGPTVLQRSPVYEFPAEGSEPTVVKESGRTPSLNEPWDAYNALIEGKF